MITNQRLLTVLKGGAVDRTPVWVMRQAGRYLPEYRRIRSEAGSFLQLCQTPELATEVTLQPLRRFNLDAAILFSDILMIPDAMGLGLSFEEGVGPVFKNPIGNFQQISQLKKPIVNSALGYVAETIRLLKQTLTVPLIGFAGSPWTVATYMLEGESNKQFTRTKQLLYRDPELLEYLLGLLTEVTIEYLSMQIEAGADLVMLFDTWGSILSTEHYERYSLFPMQKIVTALQKKVPTILFTKGGGLWLEQIAATGCTAIGLDWTISLTAAKQRLGNQVALQGNLDPGALYGTRETLMASVADVLKQAGRNTRHIFNLGHGIAPDVDPEAMRVLVDSVHELSRVYYG